MNVLYNELESLDVLEQLDDKIYDFIYLDIPYGRNPNHYFEYELKRENPGKTLERYIKETRGISLKNITREVVEQERVKLTEQGYKRYSDYVSKVIENISRILKEKGILAFLAPMQDYTKINYRLVLDQFFPSITNVTIKMRNIGLSNNVSINPDSILYFCSNMRDFQFPVLMELPPKDHYKYQDNHGDYALRPASFRARGEMELNQYEWRGFILLENQSWRYSCEKMDELFEEDRIVISNDRVFEKIYRDEHMVPVSTIWDYDDTTKLRFTYPRYIDSQSIDRMFKMFVDLDSCILCPYDRDGKFSWMADKDGYTWTSICPPGFPGGNELFSDIPEGHYKAINKLNSHNNRAYQEKIITGVNDITEFKDLMLKVNEIQTLIGVNSPDEVIDEIQNLIDSTVSETSIRASVSEARNWIWPYWDKLESESKHFIPTGVALYNQFIDDPDADMAAPMIEYCKALESELFKKLFAGYVVSLRDKKVRMQEQFPEAFENDKTKSFAEFLRNSLGHSNKNRPYRWKIELGTMVYILDNVLVNESQEPLFIDFRRYLNQVFEQDFFGSDFGAQLDRITKIRNDCAHPYIINKDDVAGNRENIKKKLVIILKYYKDEDDRWRASPV